MSGHACFEAQAAPNESDAASSRHQLLRCLKPVNVAAQGHESSRSESRSRKLPKQPASTGSQLRPGSTVPVNAGQPPPRPLLPATGLAVVGQPKGHAFDVPGGVAPGLPFWGHTSSVLAHLLQAAASQPQAAPAASVPYMLVPFSNDAPPRQQQQRPAPRPRALPRLAPRLIPRPTAAVGARSVLPPRSGGHRPGTAAARPPHAVAAHALPAPMARRPQPHTRVLGTVVSAPGPTSSAPGMYSQPAVAMRSLLASASEILNQAGAPGSAVELPMPALVNRPRLGVLPPAAYSPHASLSTLDIERAVESIASGSVSAAARPLPSGLVRPAAPSRPPHRHHTPELPSHSAANAQQMHQPVPSSALPATAGAPSLESRYPKINFSMAALAAAYPMPGGGNAPPPGVAPQQAVNPGVGAQPGPPSSRLIAALSQSLDAVPAATAQLQPAQAAALPMQSNGNSTAVTHSWPAKKTAGVPLPRTGSGRGGSGGP